MKAAESLIIFSSCTIIASRERPGLVSIYGPREPGSIPLWAPIFQCIFFLNAELIHTSKMDF